MRSCRSAAGLAAALLAPCAAFAYTPSATHEPKTAKAVEAADNAWGDAEARGDAGFVDWLLLPDYRSIGPKGQATPKAKILDGTRARAAGKASMSAADIAAWKAKHPMRADVTLFGDVAVLNWVFTRADSGEPIASCDVFVYRDGHWRAAYSQHTSAEGSI